ncbi:MAG: substrate-binding domain-containing protein [Spirochaetes bacterium]|nr:substrate-binding domain-containing protein [Spirochaetota bacterium]
MKRIVLMLTAALLAVGVVNAAGAKKKMIGVSVPSADHGWTGGIVWWANKAVTDWKASQKDIGFYLLTADSATKQVGDVEDLITKKIDMLVILPHESAPLTPVVLEAHKKGIIVVVVDRGLTQEFGYANIAGDNTAFGRICGEWIAKEMGGKGNLVCLEGLPVQINTERVKAFEAEIKKHPGIKILDSQLANWSTQKGLEVMENYLQKYKKIDAVYAQDDDVLKGVLQAYGESKRKDVKVILGGAGSKEVLKMIKDGHPLVKADVTYSPSMMRDGINFGVEVLNGKRPNDFHTAKRSTRYVIPSVLVTKENVDKFYEPKSIY